MTPPSRRMLAATALVPALVVPSWLGGAAATGGTPDATRLEVADGSVVRSAAATPRRRVVLISIDGLNPSALERLGRRGTPAIHRLVARGASTMNARTAVEQTETLPNHIGMVTGRRIDAARGGHGVTWNDERRRPRTVHKAAGHQVESVFSHLDALGRSAALYSAKDKFSLFERSWPDGVDKLMIEPYNERLVRAARRDVVAGRRAFTMVHISLPDVAGHKHGFMSRAYLVAVRQSDRLVRRLMSGVRRTTAPGRTWVVLTADHGGGGDRESHADHDHLANYRIPFVVWGPRVARGANLYKLSPGLKNPGEKRPPYRGRQPVRNGYAANLAMELLRLPNVPGSRLNVERQLNWR